MKVVLRISMFMTKVLWQFMFTVDFFLRQELQTSLKLFTSCTSNQYLHLMHQQNTIRYITVTLLRHVSA